MLVVVVVGGPCHQCRWGWQVVAIIDISGGGIVIVDIDGGSSMGWWWPLSSSLLLMVVVVNIDACGGGGCCHCIGDGCGCSDIVNAKY